MHHCGPDCVREINFRRRWLPPRWEARTSCPDHWLMGWGATRAAAAKMMIDNVLASTVYTPQPRK